MVKDSLVNCSYIESYKVYCFNANDKKKLNSSQYNYSYVKGDFLPLVSNNYMYGQDLLIVDYKNKIVHIVEYGRYIKSIKISGKVDSALFSNFRCRTYMSIDIYGNLLKVRTIYDLYDIINNYPNIDLYLIENKYPSKYMKETLEYNKKENKKKDDRFYSGYENKKNKYEDNKYLALDKIHNYSYNNLVLTGSIYSNDLFPNNISESYGDIKASIEKPLLEKFEENFIDKDSVEYKINYLLELFSVNYYLESNPDKNLITYISMGGNKKATHIDKVRREIVSFVSDLDKNEVLCIIETILSSIEDEEYLQSIIELIINILIINN